MIRKAVVEDIEDILRIEQASFSEPWSRASVEAEFYKDFARVYVVELIEAIAGYAIIWNLGHECEILTFAVDKAYRRLGIGAKLLEFVLSEAFESEKTWFLEVAYENEAALNLYEKFGFRKIGTIKDYYGISKHAFRMERQAADAVR